MAMTASLACNPTTVAATVNGNIAVTLTVSNSDTQVAIPVTSVRPYVYDNGTQQPTTSVSLPPTVAIPVSGQPVAASGSTKFYWTINCYQPQFSAKPYAGSGDTAQNLSVDVGCEVTCGDGTVLYPTVVTITVTPSTHS